MQKIKFSDLPKINLNNLISELKPLLFECIKSSARNPTEEVVNVLFFPDITGLADVYLPTIEILKTRYVNVNFWRLTAPIFYTDVFDKYGVETPCSVEDTVALYLKIFSKFKLTPKLKLKPDVFFGWSYGAVLAFQAVIEAIKKGYPHSAAMLVDAVSPTLQLQSQESKQNWILFEKNWEKFQETFQDSSAKKLDEIIDFTRFSKIEGLEQVRFACEKFDEFIQKKIVIANERNNTVLKNKLNVFVWLLTAIWENKKAYVKYDPNATLNNVLKILDMEKEEFLSVLPKMVFVYSENTYQQYDSIVSSKPYLGWPVHDEFDDSRSSASENSESGEENEDTDLGQKTPILNIIPGDHFNALQSANQKKTCITANRLDEVISTVGKIKAMWTDLGKNHRKGHVNTSQIHLGAFSSADGKLSRALVVPAPPIKAKLPEIIDNSLQLSPSLVGTIPAINEVAPPYDSKLESKQFVWKN